MLAHRMSEQRNDPERLSDYSVGVAGGTATNASASR